MRTLAIDLGTRRIGLALSDEGGRFATPHDVLHITSVNQAIPEIAKLIRAEGVERIILGLPINMDDSIGPAARKTIEWGTQLSRASDLPVIYVDERLSSFAAEQSLTDRKKAGERLTRKDRKERLDALAAARFLQDFLDGKLLPIAGL